MKNPFLATKYDYCFASLYVSLYVRRENEKIPIIVLCQINRDDFPSCPEYTLYRAEIAKEVLESFKGLIKFRRLTVIIPRDYISSKSCLAGYRRDGLIRSTVA